MVKSIVNLSTVINVYDEISSKLPPRVETRNEVDETYRLKLQRFTEKFAQLENIILNETANVESNTTNSTSNLFYSLPVLITVCSVLSLIIVATIIGNVFVISAILLEKTLQAASNYLILSLAVTDLMVAVLVMPISIIYEVHTEWILGPEVCDMWVSFDMLCCTASILHLVAIALDRYWSVTNVDYTRKRSPIRILVMIFLVWFVSFSVSVPPLLGWRQPSNYSLNTSDCMISQDIGYTVYSTFGAFYIPLILILLLNYKIYIVARSRFQKCLEKKGVLRAALQAQRASITMLVGGPDCAPSHGIEVTNCKSDTSIIKHGRTHTGEVGIVNTNVIDTKTTLHVPVLTLEPSIIEDEVSHIGDLNRRKSSNLSNSMQTKLAHSTSGGNLTVPGDSPTGVTKNLLDPNVCLAPNQPRKFSSILADPVSSVMIHSEIPSSVRPTLHTQTSTADTDNTDPEFAEGYILIPGTTTNKNKTAKVRRLMIPEIKKEKRTASVLGFITCAFILCWLPFFIAALVVPLCGDKCRLPRGFTSFILWLGYFNSMINPIIYTIFNPNFRVAFKKLYCSGSKREKYPKI